MAFALDDSENEHSDVVVLDEDKSPETVVTKSKEQEDVSRMVSHVTSQFGSTCLQSAQKTLVLMGTMFTSQMS